MSIFDEFNEEGIEALRPTNRTFFSLPETSGNALDAIAFSGSESGSTGFQSLFKDSPFGDDSIFAVEKPSDLWKGYVDFYKALERFGIGSLTDISIEEGIVLDEITLEGKVIKSAFDYRNVIDTKKSFQSHWELSDNAYVGYVYVNKKIDYLSDKALFFSYDGVQEYPPYDSAFSIYKPYNTDRNVGSLNYPNVEYLKNNAALQIQGLSFKGMLIILQGLENRTADRKYIESGYQLLARTVEQFTLSFKPPKDYIEILAHLNDQVLQHINIRILEKLWSRFVEADRLTNIYEVILLNVLKGLSNKPDFNTDTFLKRLLSNTIKGKTEFERLYDKMNDWGGSNNFSKLILRLLLIWKDSGFTRFENPAFKNFDRPVNLAYKQKKILGFRVDDYDFEFGKDGAILAEIEPGVSLPNNPIGSIIIDNILQKEERYHPFFPVTLTELDETENEELKLETTIPVPAFYLKAFDDKGAWENFEKGLWLAVDIITTATGVGNLLKLRHVLKLKNAFVYLKLAFGVVEVASGIVGIALNFVDKCEDKTFCNKLRQYLFWFEICTLGADALTTRILSKQAREAKDALVAYRKNVKDSKKQKELDELEEHLGQIFEQGLKNNKGGDINKSFFANIGSSLKQEEALGNVLGQTEEYTCVANTLRMVLDDLGAIRSEKFLENALGTTRDGANILDIPNALKNDRIEGLKFISRGGPKDKNITFNTLLKQFKRIENKKIIVSVRGEDIGAHAVVVDKIEDNRIFLRDPLPLNQGSSYSITIDEFEKVFNKKFLIINP